MFWDAHPTCEPELRAPTNQTPWSSVMKYVHFTEYTTCTTPFKHAVACLQRLGFLLEQRVNQQDADCQTCTDTSAVDHHHQYPWQALAASSAVTGLKVRQHLQTAMQQSNYYQTHVTVSGTCQIYISYRWSSSPVLHKLCVARQLSYAKH